MANQPRGFPRIIDDPSQGVGQPPPPQGVSCFMNMGRICGPDCMAFVPDIERPADKDYIGKEWSRCLVLINVHRVGKHVSILAVQAEKVVNKFQSHLADQKRENQNSNIPEPR